MAAPTEPGAVNVLAHDPDASVHVLGLTDPVVVDQDTVPVGVVRPLAGVDVSDTVAVHDALVPIATGFGVQTTATVVECGAGGGGAAGAVGAAEAVATPAALTGGAPVSVTKAAIVALATKAA